MQADDSNRRIETLELPPLPPLEFRAVHDETGAQDVGKPEPEQWIQSRDCAAARAGVLMGLLLTRR